MNPTRITSILRPVLWVGMLLFALTGVTLYAQKKVPPTTQHHLRILHTTDVHGNIFPYDFLNDRAGTGSMSRLSTVLREIRRTDPAGRATDLLLQLCRHALAPHRLFGDELPRLRRCRYGESRHRAWA